MGINEQDTKYTRHKLAGKLDVFAVYENGAKLKVKQDRLNEQGKVGCLRGGNAGLADYEGGKVRIAGNCHRLSYLRMKGVQVKEESESKRLMFLGGHLNEEGWVATLQQGLPEGLKILREQEVGTCWTTKNGTKVTGSPDIVIASEGGELIQALELKRICSVWTARDILAGCPRPTHVFQAAHYALCLGVPYELWYSCDVNFYAGRMNKLFPKKGTLAGDKCSYDDKGNIKNVEPFHKGFIFDFRDDVLYIKEDLSTTFEETIVTKQRIENYYEYVSTMEERNSIGPTPTNIDHRGDTMGFTTCQYCELKSICSNFNGDNLTAWMGKVLG